MGRGRDGVMARMGFFSKMGHGGEGDGLGCISGVLVSQLSSNSLSFKVCQFLGVDTPTLTPSCLGDVYPLGSCVHHLATALPWWEGAASAGKAGLRSQEDNRVID